jgi:hypothetical protein
MSSKDLVGRGRRFQGLERVEDRGGRVLKGRRSKGCNTVSKAQATLAVGRGQQYRGNTGKGHRVLREYREGKVQGGQRPLFTRLENLVYRERTKVEGRWAVSCKQGRERAERMKKRGKRTRWWSGVLVVAKYIFALQPQRGCFRHSNFHLPWVSKNTHTYTHTHIYIYTRTCTMTGM